MIQTAFGTLFTDGELNHEVEALRKKAVTKNVTGKD